MYQYMLPVFQYMLDVLDVFQYKTSSGSVCLTLSLLVSLSLAQRLCLAARSLSESVSPSLSLFSLRRVSE